MRDIVRAVSTGYLTGGYMSVTCEFKQVQDYKVVSE